MTEGVTRFVFWMDDGRVPPPSPGPIPLQDRPIALDGRLDPLPLEDALPYQMLLLLMQMVGFWTMDFFMCSMESPMYLRLRPGVGSRYLMKPELTDEEA